MCRLTVEMIWIFIFCCCSYVTAQVDLNEVITRNISDENVLLKLLVMHMEETNKEMKDVKEKLQTCEVNRNELIELRAMIQNITETPQRREMPGSKKIGRLFIDNIYKKKNIPTSTEMPVVPAINMSTMEHLLKLFVRRTCDDWLKAGFTSSGTYTIDPDGQGIGEPPFTVYCDMLTGFTFLRHDMDIGQHSPTPCTGISCYKAKISYSTSDTQMRALIQSSQSCQQLITVDCFESPFEYEGQQLSWWIGLDGQRHYDWTGGGFDEHTCSCGLVKSCVNPLKTCNCDAVLPNVWVTDSGYVTNSSSLPIQEIVFGTRDDHTPLEVTFQIGPLRCHGARTLSYPTTCLDLFLLGGRRSGWYMVGQPGSLRAAFCDMETLHETEAQPSPRSLHGIELVDVDFGDLVLHSLQSKGFLIPKEVQVNEMVKNDKILEDKIELMNSDIMKRIEQMDNALLQYVNETKNDIIHSANDTTRKTTVVFHANRETGTLSVSARSIIVYTTVKVNVGSGYSPETGKFTAPVSGLYYIAAYSEKHGSHHFIRKNGKPIAIARDRETSQGYSTMGTAVITELNVGDKVDVVLEKGLTRGLASHAGDSFMGYLLSET